MDSKANRDLDRREFVKRSCLGAAGAGLLGYAGLGVACSTSGQALEARNDVTAKKGSQPGPKIRARTGPVVVSRVDEKVFGANGHDEKRVRRLVHDAIRSLVGVKDTKEAFRALFEPDDVVAIKLNCLAGPGMSSSVAVVDALVAGLGLIGIDNRRIFIWERSSAELARAGFQVNQYLDNRPRCFGNDDGGYEQKIRFSGEVGSLWSDVLATRATALINVPVLKDHDLSGVGCGMKNLFGAIHNPNRYHDNNCDPFVADVSAHPFVKDKLRLVLADALTAQYHGGPARVIAHQWKAAKILAATDPVALDRVAQKLIDEQRKAHGMASLEESNRPPRWLKTAAQKGLGEHRLEKITLDEG